MNSDILDDLEAHVGQVLSAVSARPDRLRQMQAELLAHLLSVYDEEVAHLGDEQAAIHAAKRRFGQVDDLAPELEICVPFLERTFFHLVNRKGTLMKKWFLLAGGAAIPVGVGFVCPAIANLISKEAAVGITVAFLLFGSAVTLGGLGSLVYGIKAFRTRTV